MSGRKLNDSIELLDLTIIKTNDLKLTNEQITTACNGNKSLIVIKLNNIEEDITKENIKQLDFYCDQNKWTEINACLNGAVRAISVQPNMVLFSLFNTTNNTLGSLFNEHVKKVFELISVQSRPIKKYQTTFYYPFDINGEHLLRACEHDDDGIFPNEELRYRIDQGFDEDSNQTLTEKNKKSIQTFLYFKPRFQKAMFSFTEKALQDSASSRAEPIFKEFRLGDKALAGAKLSLDLSEKPKSESSHDDTCKTSHLPANNENIISADVDNVSLLQHPVSKGSFLLSVQTSFTPSVLFNSDDAAKGDAAKGDAAKGNSAKGNSAEEDWPFALLAAMNCNKKVMDLHQSQYGHWLRFTKLVRILHVTFVKQLNESKISPITFNQPSLGHSVTNFENLTEQNFFPTSVKIPNNKIVAYLTSQFFCSNKAVSDLIENSFEYRQDSRMHCLATYGLAGNYPSTPQAKQILDRHFYLAQYVDTFSDCFGAYAYNEKYLADLSAAHNYDRWRDITYRASFNEYAGVFVGYGGFYLENITPNIEKIYHYMMAYSLLSKEVLHCLSRAIAKASDSIREITDAQVPKSDEFRQVRSNLIAIINQYWFVQLSSEQQGIELFERMKAPLKLNEHFEQVNEKIAIADDYIESKRETYYISKADKMSVAAIGIAVLALVFSFPFSLESFFGPPYTKTSVALLEIVGRVVLAFVCVGIVLKSKEKIIKGIMRFEKQGRKNGK